MMLAYVQVSLNKRNERDVYDKLINMPEVKEAHILFGEWDIIALLDMDSPEHLGSFVMENIRSLPGVNLTSTMIVAK